MHAELLIGGHFYGSACDSSVPKDSVHAPYNGKRIGTVAEATQALADAAVEAASQAFPNWSKSAIHVRRALLRKVSDRIRVEKTMLAELLAQEVGKPIKLAEGEVDRLALTFDLAHDLLSQPAGHVLPADYDPRGEGYRIFAQRFPIGPIFGIVPYNWPFNLAAHKLAPALAAGNTIVLKTSSQASLSTLTLAKLIHECGCPDGVFNAIRIPAADAEAISADDRIKMISFTGSPKVGWGIKQRYPQKRVSLELGGNAFAIVDRSADLDWAVKRIVAGGYGYAGQVCIAVQHVLAHHQILPELRERLIEATISCKWGDPMSPETVCGPLITEEAALKVMEWIHEAESAGATVLAGGNRSGSLVEPTLIENVPTGTQLASEEVFGPVLTLEAFESLDQAVERLNEGKYGIQCGFFSADTAASETLFRAAEVGGVIVNDYPTLRFDNMPYGGVKRSGYGREGVQFAFEEMTEWKTLVERRCPATP